MFDGSTDTIIELTTPRLSFALITAQVTPEGGRLSTEMVKPALSEPAGIDTVLGTPTSVGLLLDSVNVCASSELATATVSDAGADAEPFVIPSVNAEFRGGSTSRIVVRVAVPPDGVKTPEAFSTLQPAPLALDKVTGKVAEL
jgi:hypothetical protein